jgi:hypothetical protein
MTYVDQSNNNNNQDSFSIPSSTIQRKSKRKRIQKAIETTFSTTFSTIMNAAVTIFGVGVGVGLILGDSFRGTETVGSVTVTTTTTSAAARRAGGAYTERNEESVETASGRDSGTSQMFSNDNLLPAQ